MLSDKLPSPVDLEREAGQALARQANEAYLRGAGDWHTQFIVNPYSVGTIAHGAWEDGNRDAFELARDLKTLQARSDAQGPPAP